MARRPIRFAIASLLTIASLFVANVPEVEAATCTALSAGFPDGVGCPALPANQWPGQKGFAIGTIHSTGVKSVCANYLGSKTGTFVYYAFAGGVDANGALINGCAVFDYSNDGDFAIDYSGCSAAVKVRVTVMY